MLTLEEIKQQIRQLDENMKRYKKDRERIIKQYEELFGTYYDPEYESFKKNCKKEH